MTAHTAGTVPRTRRVVRCTIGAAPRSTGVGLLVLAAGLAANSVVGPGLLGVVEYPISETLQNETIGLEATSLILVAPWSAVAGVLVLRGRRFGSVLALAPAAYVAYMFVQYLAGIPAVTYGPHHLLQLGLFVLAGWILVEAWVALGEAVTVLDERRSRRWAAALGAMAGFIVLRWLPSLVGAATGGALPDVYAGDPGMHWTIFLLDLGVVVPCSVATVRGLLAHRAWASTALHALVGWFTLVPPSVLAMAIVKHVDGDPLASWVDTAMFGVATLAYLVAASLLYRPSRDR